jgi:hypothetical protein
MSATNGNGRADAALVAGQTAAAERLARAVVLAFDVCEEGGVPLSELQKVAILEAALLEFDGFEAELGSRAAVSELLRDLGWHRLHNSEGGEHLGTTR